MLNWIKNLKKGLNKSSKKINEGLTTIFKAKKINIDVIEDLQDLLISSDIGLPVTDEIVANLKKIKLTDISINAVKKNIYNSFIEILTPVQKNIDIGKKPYVILMIGVNGSGKTSTTGKLASKFVKKKKKVGL